MIRVRDLMTVDVITFTPDTEISKAAKVLLENRINGAPVVDENQRLLGILCQSDLIAQQKRFPVPTLFTILDGYIPLSSTRQIEREVRKIAALTVSEAMTPDPVTVDPDTDLEKVAGLMVDKNLHTLPVVEGGRLVGIIGKEDVLKTLLSGQ
ncbi:MAG: CBS domain-containing protein [Desulfobacterales bacterium]|nr:CBS domain-containing protein [Desulfobacterales bacterium]